jgi:hypothetical protein
MVLDFTDSDLGIEGSREKRFGEVTAWPGKEQERVFRRSKQGYRQVFACTEIGRDIKGVSCFSLGQKQA